MTTLPTRENSTQSLNGLGDNDSLKVPKSRTHIPIPTNDMQNLKEEFQSKVASANFVWEEFKANLEREDVLDTTFGIVAGGAFTDIFNAFSNDIVFPFISHIMGKPDFKTWYYVLHYGNGPKKQYKSHTEAIKDGAKVILYGNFFQKLIRFIFLGYTLMFFMKLSRSLLKGRKKAIGQSNTKCQYCKESINPEATRCPKCTSVLDKPAHSSVNKLKQEPN